VLILGTVQGYMSFQRAHAPPPARQVQRPSAPGRFELDVTLTFAAAPDDFEVDPAALLVRQGSVELLRRKTPLPAGEPVRLAAPDVRVGANEFYLRAWPAAAAAGEHAARVRVLRDGEVLAERTLWARPGEPVEGAIALTVPALESEPAGAGRTDQGS
jgi:hypothetical protein